MAKSSNDEARRISKHACRDCSCSQPGQRLAPAPLRNQTRRVRAKAEIRGMAQRDDTGIAEDEIERQCEQRRDGDLTRQHEVVGSEHERQQCREPKGKFNRLPANLRLDMALRLAQCGRRHQRLPNSPSGRHISSGTITKENKKAPSSGNTYLPAMSQSPRRLA